MKKSIICLLGLSFVVLACTREQNPAQNSEENTPFSIVAKISDGEMVEVKTDYDEFYANPKFSWVDGDMIAVQLEERENAGTYNQHKFTTTGGDASATFTATAGLNVTTYKLSTYAFYPQHNSDENGRDIIYDHGTYQDVYFNPVATVPKDELKAIVPLIGTRDSGTADNATTDVLYNFTTLTGVMRLSLNNVPAAAKKVKVTSALATAYLTGYAYLTSLSDGELSMSEFWYGGTPSKTIIFDFTPTEGEDLIIYVPIPTGELTGGFTVDILGEKDAEILSRSVSEDITIERNKIYFAPDITFDASWRSIGTGWFGDNYLFAQTSFNKAGRMVPVDIQQNTTNANQYRIRNPYGAAAKILGVELGGFNNAYLTFTLDGIGGVSFGDHKSGIRFSNKNTMLHDVSSSHDAVIYDSTNPKLVKLSPKYFMETSSGSKTYTDALSDRSGYTNIINIVFPGYEIGEVFAFEWGIGGATNKITMAPISGDPDYNVKITRYYYSGSSLDISGTCKGTYDPIAGTLVFPQLQQFADTGTIWDGASYTGSAIAYSFRGYSSVSENLSFTVDNANGYWKTSNTKFKFDKYVVDYNSTSGYLQFHDYSAPTLQRQH